MNILALRDYQVETLHNIKRQWDKGYTSTLCNLATGLGKTEIFVTYAYDCSVNNGKRSLILTPAHIIMQTKHRFLRRYPSLNEPIKMNLIDYQKSVGVIMGTFNEPDSRIIIGSIQTLIDRVPTDVEPITREDIVNDGSGKVWKSSHSKRKCLISERMDEVLSYGMIDEIIYDEAHHAVSDGGLLLINRLWELCDILGRERCKLIGFTATAFREDGRSLGNLFQTFAIQKSIRYGIANGYLAQLRTPIRIHAVVEQEHAKALKTENWDKLLVQAWYEKGEMRPTLAYFNTVNESIQFCRTAQEQGIKAVHVDGTTCISLAGRIEAKEYRDRIFRQFIRGEIDIICNHAVLLEAIDLPPASCLLWARSTENIVLLTQAIGRIVRLFHGNEFLPEKRDALILDATSSDLEMLTLGTLAGFKVDATQGIYIVDEKLEQEESFRIAEGIDLRDAHRGLATSNGVQYSIGRLIQKSGTDWFHGDEDVLSLAISTNDTLVIHPPFYTLANDVNRLSERLRERIELDPFNQTLKDIYNRALYAYDVFNNYTLWHIRGNNIPDTYVRADDSLSLLMDFAIPFAYEVSDPINTFIKRNADWKKNHPMTEKQKFVLTKELKSDRIEEGLTKGEAAQLITHLRAFKRGVAISLAKILNELGSYLQYEQVN